MQGSKASSTQDASEKSALGVERPITPEDIARGEVLEDDGEIFKVNADQAQFRALGM
jgi:hypothetical protein